MGTKVTVDNIENVAHSSGLPKVNANYDKLADEFDKVLYRNGSQAAQGNMDMDSHRIINLPAPLTSGEPARLQDLETVTDGVFVALLNNKASYDDLLGPTGTSLIAVGQTLLANLIPVTPLQFGAVGDGVADDTDAIDDAMATGRNVEFPEDYTFLTNTLTGHRFVANNQKVTVNGTILYGGATHAADLPDPYTGFFGIFSGLEVDNISIVGSGTIDGGWDGDTTLEVGRIGSGVLLSKCSQALIKGPQFQNFYDDGVKAYNCPELNVERPTKFFKVRNIMIEMKSYADNPLAVFGAAAGYLSGAWDLTTLKGPSGSIDGTFEWADDNLHGAGNGTGVDFSSSADAPPCHDLKIRGTFIDCLLAVWSENNFDFAEAYNIDIDVTIVGNTRPGVVECSDGIGLIGVRGGRVRAQIKDQTNIAPPGGAETVGVNIIQCTDVEVDVRIENDAAIVNKMQHAIKLSGSTNIRIKGSQQGVSGISTLSPTVVSPILFDTGALIDFACTDVTIDGFQGGGAANTWISNYGGSGDDYSVPGGLMPFRFMASNLPASTATSLLTISGAGSDKEILPTSGRLVGASARIVGAVTGTFTIAATVSGAAQPLVTLTEADFAASGFSAAKQAPGIDCAQCAQKGTLEVVMNTDGAWTATSDVEVTLWFDPRWKR